MILGMMLSWLLGLGAILMTLGLSVNAIWRAVMPPSGLPRGAGCGSCGYELTTLTAGRCSECGADLIKSGVTTRRNAVRAAGSLPAALMGWTVIVITIGSIGSMMVFTLLAFNSGMAGGGVQQVVNTRTLEPDTFNNADSGEFVQSAAYEVTFEYDGEYNFQGAISGTVTVEIEGDDVTTPLVVTIDVETEDFTVVGDDGVELSAGSGFGASEAEGLLEMAGLDMTHPGIADEAEQMGEIFDEVLNDPMNFESMYYSVTDSDAVGGLIHTGGNTNFAPSFGIASSSNELIMMGSVLIVGVLIYGLGVVFIIRRRSKLLAPVQSASD